MKTVTIDMPESYEHILAPDIHIGNSAIAYDKLRALIARVKSKKNCYISFSGDQLEGIDVQDKRFNLDVHRGMDARISAQRDAFVAAFTPLMGRILWVLDGNHELKWRNIFTPNDDIARALGCEYAGGTMIKAIFPSFRMINWHGYGRIMSRAGDPKQRTTNDEVALKRKLRNLPGGDCELIACGHFHRIILSKPNSALELITDPVNGKLMQVYTEPRKIWIDEKKGLYRIPEEDKWYAATGSVLRSYVDGMSTYGEERGFQATELGCIAIIVRNGKMSVEKVIF